MPTGLPAHLIASTSTRSVIRASQAIVGTYLVIALLTVLVFQARQPQLVLWPAAVAVIPMIALLAINRRRATVLSSVSYLVIGGMSAYLYALTFLSQVDPAALRDVYPLALLQIALVMVPGPGIGQLPRLAWVVAGLVVATTATFAASLGAGESFSLEIPTLVLFAGAVVAIVQTDLSHRRLRRTPSRLHRAARDEYLADVRFRIELKAAALLHDTILSHLAAIADSTRELGADLRSQMERDLQVLVGEEWLARESADFDDEQRKCWRESPLFSAVRESRDLGLEIEVTGDPAAVGRLPRDASIALGLAVKQCLVNVIKHSGTLHAEVAVYGSNTDVSVMIVDTGRGFSEDEVSADRFGLRTSVRQRIDLVGGFVKVFSTIGRGTSVMIRIPVDTRPGVLADGSMGLSSSREAESA